MKKSLSYIAVAAVALSAVSVAPITSEAASPTGVYDTTANKYYSTAQFQKLTNAEKGTLLSKAGVYFVVGTKVVPASAATGTNAEIKAAAIEKDKFTAANLDAIHAGTTPPVTGDLKVESVSAINTSVNAVTNNQVLPVQINGSQSVTVKQLTDAGYTVKFSSNKAVFSSATTSTTGVVDSLAANFGNFNYKVEVTKDGKTISSSATGAVTLVDASATKEITEYEIKKGTVKLTSGTLNAEDSSYKIAATKGTNVKGDTVTTFTGATYTSSDNKVALVGTDGTITPVKAGTVTITIKHGTATKAVTLTITEAARTLTTLKADKATVGIVAGGANETLTVKGYDQLGDEKALSGTGSAVSSATAVATVGITGTGDTVTVTVTPVAQGSATITVTVDGKTLSIPVTVGENKVATRKIEIVKSANTSDDAIIDKVKTSDDTIVLAYKGYNAANQLVGDETLGTYNAATPPTGYSVDVTVKDSGGNAVASTSVNDYVAINRATKSISLTAKKAGTATVTIYDGAINVDSYEVTLKNSTPTVSAVKFETGAKITATTTTTDVVKVTGLTFTSTPATTVQIAASSEAGTITDSASPANELGTIDLKKSLTGASSVALSESSGTLILQVTQLDQNSVKGTVTVRIKNNTGIVDVKEITVDIAAIAPVLTYSAITATKDTTSVNVTPSNGSSTSPTNYALKTGSTLPAGLSLNATTGEITGTPSAATTGAQTVTIVASYTDNGVTKTVETTVSITVTS